ncbi:MAG: fluoride efflux transporter CrcB [Verrucomicrobiales bacterium]
MNYLLIAAGSALGGVARHLATTLALRWSNPFPWGTFLVNVAGSLLIGFFAALIPMGNSHARLFLLTGFLGGFTTFSAFSLQSFELIQQQKTGMALAYSVGSVITCLLAVSLGYWIAQLFTGRSGSRM